MPFATASCFVAFAWHSTVGNNIYGSIYRSGNGESVRVVASYAVNSIACPLACFILPILDKLGCVFINNVIDACCFTCIVNGVVNEFGG